MVSKDDLGFMEKAEGIIQRYIQPQGWSNYVNKIFSCSFFKYNIQINCISLEVLNNQTRFCQ